MEQFRYRLQLLLDLKIERRQDRERALAERQRELAAEQTALAELEREQERLESVLREGRRSRLVAGAAADGHKLQLRTQYLLGVASDVEIGRGAVSAQRLRVGEFQDRVAQAREALAEAAREVEVLKKHRERLEKRFLRLLEQREMQEQDEMGGILFNQRRRANESSR